MASSSLSQLYSYLKPHRGSLLLGVFTLLTTNALGVAIPWLLAQAIDDLGRKLTSGGLLYYTLLILGLATVMGLIRVWSRVLLFSIGRRVEFDLKGRIFAHLLRMSPAYFAQNPVGDLINRATSDVENVRRLLGFALLSIINTFCLHPDFAGDARPRWGADAAVPRGLSADVFGGVAVFRPAAQ